MIPQLESGPGDERAKEKRAQESGMRSGCERDEVVGQ